MRHACFALAAVIAAVAPVSAGVVDVRGLIEPVAPAVTRAQIAPYLREGTAAIRGRAILALPGVRTLYFRRASITLWPLVPYANWLMDERIRAWGRASTIEYRGDDPLFVSALRSGIADDEGRFRFTKLPALPYVVVVDAVETEPRTGTRHASSYVTTMEYQYGIGYHPVSTLVDRPYTYRYTCRSAGFGAGLVTAVAGEERSTALALMGARNDGC